MAKRQRHPVRNTKRAVITLSGLAAEIWERLPKGIRSDIVARLLEEAYHCGRLDLVLTRPLEGQDRTIKFQPKTIDSSEAFSPIDYSERQKGMEKKRGEAREPVLQEKEKVKEPKDRPEEYRERKSQEEPDWLRDLDRKISKTINF